MALTCECGLPLVNDQCECASKSEFTPMTPLETAKALTFAKLRIAELESALKPFALSTGYGLDGQQPNSAWSILHMSKKAFDKIAEGLIEALKNAEKIAEAIAYLPDSPEKLKIWTKYIRAYGYGILDASEINYKTGPKIAAERARAIREKMTKDAEESGWGY